MKALLYGVKPEPHAGPRDRQPSPAQPRADPDEARRDGRARILPAGLGRHPAPPHRHLRLRLQAGVHGLGRGALARQPDEGRSSRCRRCSGTRSSPTSSRSGPEAEGLEVGDRVVLNPWLSCGPRGVTPLCPACEVGDFSLCYSFDVGPIPPGIHIGTSQRRQRRLRASSCRRTTRSCSRFPTTSPTSSRCSPTRSRCRCTRSRATRRRRAARSMVYGAGALGTCATAILPRAVPRRRSARRRALRGAGRDGAQARRQGHRAHARVAGDRGSGRVVGRRAARERRTADGVPGLHRRRVRHRRQAGDVRGRARACSRRAARS